MSNVTFDEGPMPTISGGSVRYGGAVGFLMRHRIVRTVSQAQLLLLAIACIIFISAVFLGRASTKGAEVDPAKNLIPAVSSR